MNVGPVGDVLGINEKLSDPFLAPISRLVCEYCSNSKAPNGQKLKVCDRCKMAAYCSKSCQKKTWKTHKQHCDSYKRADAAYKEEQNEK